MVLNDVCELIVDCPHTTSPDIGEGYPLIRTPNIGCGRFLLDGVHRVNEKSYKERTKRAIPQDNDLIFAREAPAGNVAIIKNGEKYCLGQRTVLIRPNSDLVNPDFLTYYLLAPEQQYGLLGTANGATVPHVNLPTIRNLKISLPQLNTQRRIADILSSYDDLIENNQRQIKLLEEAALRIYKEWFVSLRFPSHEKTPIEDGVPEGWRYESLDAIAIYAGKNERKENRNKYSCYLPIDCLPKKSLACIDFSSVTEAESSLVAFSKNDILFGAMRPYFHKVIVSPSDGLTRSTCFVINSKEPHFWSYLVMLLFNEETIKYATQISVGTTMPYVRWKDFAHMPVLIPDKYTAEYFQSICNPIIQQILILAKQIGLAQNVRDRLLPKLMSGEIEV